MTSRVGPADIAVIDREGGRVPGALLRLNNAHATELSYLTAEEMSTLVAQAFVAARVGDADAFILAFDQSAAYASPNFLWFRERFARFVYIDRVCVDPAQRGRGLARALYAHVLDRARAASAGRVVCEVNTEPPNPMSDAFHATQGFREIGSATLADRGKRVRYLEHVL